MVGPASCKVGGGRPKRKGVGVGAELRREEAEGASVRVLLPKMNGAGCWLELLWGRQGKVKGVVADWEGMGREGKEKSG